MITDILSAALRKPSNVAIAVACLLVCASCQKPVAGTSPNAAKAGATQDQPSPFCTLSPDPKAPWLPTTPVPNETAIPTPRGGPGDDSDCQFYRPAWQRFLVATQPGRDGPAFLDYPSSSSLFAGGSPPGGAMLLLVPRDIQRPNNPTPAVQTLLDTGQAGIGGGSSGVLIDRNGHFIYFAIYVNSDFRQFVVSNGLTTVSAIKAADPNFSFLGSLADAARPKATDIVEYKSAWMIVDKTNPPSNYFVVDALVPHLIASNGALVQQNGPDGKPQFDQVKAALIALHVVFTLPGHPEMIWSTFEHAHVDASGEAKRDNAPAAKDNPAFTSADAVISNDAYPLYKAGTKAQDANKPVPLNAIVKAWNPDRQAAVVANGFIVQSSVYRPYPGSKTDGSTAHPDHGEDNEITVINKNATQMFEQARANGSLKGNDKRQFYRLVGATWLDRPVAGPNPSFAVGKDFLIDQHASTDDDGQTIAGEGRLGSTAMESFTEFEAGAPSCFSCHDTNAVRDKQLLLKPKLLNVSHVFSKYVDANTPTQQQH